MIRDYEVGSTVYLRINLGDYTQEAGHITVPRGTSGKIVEFYDQRTEWRDDPMVRIEVPTSPGQKVLTTKVEDLRHTWMPTQERDRNFWCRLMSDEVI